MIGAIFPHLQRMSDAQQTGTLPTWLNRAAVIVVWLLCISAYISKKVPIFVIKTKSLSLVRVQLTPNVFEQMIKLTRPARAVRETEIQTKIIAKK